MSNRSKICTTCGKEKLLSEFRLSKEGKFGRSSSCKKCLNEQVKQYCLENPWLNTLSHIKQRCNNPNNPRYDAYGGRGIKCLITANELKQLWFRDRAFEMKRPSIDRIDNNCSYIFENCRYIELSENSRNSVLKPILQYNLEGIFIREWESPIIVQNTLGYCKTWISYCARIKSKSAYGFIWKYKN
jgi:hypothetical protein